MTMKKYELEFFERTLNHICLVQECALEIAESGKFDDHTSEVLLRDVVKHDASKFSDKERQAYTEYWHEMTVGDRVNAQEFKSAQWRKFQRAWNHHKGNNAHHPEWWQPHNYMMSTGAVLEMVCDWAAMSRELGDSLHTWAKKMYKKWPTLDRFKETIDTAVDTLENKETVKKIEVTMAPISDDERKVVGEVLVQMSTMLKKWDSHEMVMVSDFRDHNVPGWIQRLAPLVAAGSSDDPEMQKFYDKMRKVTEETFEGRSKKHEEANAR